MEGIHTVNDLMTKAAEALSRRDIETIERLHRVSNGWLQDNESQEAQSSMLDSMLEAVYALEECK